MSEIVTVVGRFSVTVEIDDFDLDDDEAYEDAMHVAEQKVEDGDFDENMLVLEVEEAYA